MGDFLPSIAIAIPIKVGSIERTLNKAFALASKALFPYDRYDR